MLTELQKTLKEKTRLLDEEKRLKEQTEETHEKMKKKWDKISQGDNPAEQQLIDECEELRVRGQCESNTALVYSFCVFFTGIAQV